MKKAAKGYLWKYTLLFAGVSFVVFLPFLLEGRSFVCKVDGQSQYIVYLRYMGQFLREWFRGIAGGKLIPPQYDFSIGIGDDINAIVRFHPLDFLAAFFPASKTESVYALILLLRFYLAGLSFSAYAFYWNTVPVSGERQPRMIAYSSNVMAGSLVYLFGGFMLIRVTNHPIYAAPFIVLPLLLLGAEHVLHGQGFLLFPLMVMLGFWSNYYFMYILSIALLIYMLIRFPEVYPRRPGRKADSGKLPCGTGGPGGETKDYTGGEETKDYNGGERTKEFSGGKRMLAFFILTGKMVCLYLLGLCMSLATLLPTVLRYLSSTRLSQASQTKNLLVYEDKRRYAAWFLNLISPYRSSGNGTDLNFAVIVLPAAALLFALEWKKLRSLKLTLIAELLFLLIPAGGYILAGFNNENNRWMFLIALSLGMAVVFLGDSFRSLSRRQAAFLIGSTALFCLGVLAQTAFDGFNIYNTAAAAELAAAAVLLLALSRRKASLKLVRGIVLALTVASTAVSGILTYAHPFGAVAEEYTKAGQSLAKYRKYAPAAAAKKAARSGGGLLDRTEIWDLEHGYENSAEFWGYSGISMYNSILNAGFTDALAAQNNLGLDAVTQIHDLNGRPVSELMSRVRWFAVPEDQPAAVPYGFRKEPVLEKDGILVYESDCLLPEAYSYDSFITREDYDLLTDLQRELVQLHAVVLDAEKADSPSPAEALRSAGLTQISAPPEEILTETISDVTTEEGVIRTSDGYEVSRKKGRITLPVQRKAGYTAFLRLKGLHAEDEYFRLQLASDGLSYETTVRNAHQVYNVGRDEYLFNLGYSDEDRSGDVTLTFFAPGSYDLEEITVQYMPMDSFRQAAEMLNEESLENAVVSAERLEGTIRLTAPKFIVFPVARANGWSLTVDGEKRKAEGANQAYMGLLLEAGEHEIQLIYRTPGLKAGALASAAAILIWILLALVRWRRQRQEKGRTGRPERSRFSG